MNIHSFWKRAKTSRVEIESILDKNIGAYLDRLENEYNIIKKTKHYLLLKSNAMTRKSVSPNSKKRLLT